MLAPWKKSYDQPKQHIKNQRHHFAIKSPCSQSYGFPVVMWKLDHKESWAVKNLCFTTVMLEKTLESPLDWEEIKPINPKEINPEYSLEGLMMKLQLQYFGHLMQTANPLEKTLIAGKNRREEEKGATEDEMFRWHHWLNRHESEQPPGDGERQWSLMCCSLWGHKVLGTTERLNHMQTTSCKMPGCMKHKLESI